MHDKVEAAVGESTQILHIALHGFDRQVVFFSRLAVALQLCLRIVEDGHLRPGCRQDRPLLPSAGGQAQHMRLPQLSQPVHRDGFVRRQNDARLSATGSRQLIFRSRESPWVALGYFLVPGEAVVLEEIHIIILSKSIASPC